jgi:hypothetical protein
MWVSPMCSGSAGLIRWLLLDLGVLPLFGRAPVRSSGFRYQRIGILLGF